MSTKAFSFSRREFLFGIPVVLLALWKGWDSIFKKSSVFPGSIIGANARTGHLMRFGKFPAVSGTQELETVIVGGGISGLSAAWWLNRNGHKNFQLFELDHKTGGNSQWGENKVSSYPWGAHYLPVPGDDAVYVQEFLEEIGVIKSRVKGQPVYDEYFLCADPGDRLFFQGHWQEGLIPQLVTDEEKKDHTKFFELMKEFKSKNGRDGKKAFTIPLDLSSLDADLLALDKISMKDWLLENNLTSETLHWYVNYCCRDDFGLTSENCSAWAGIHYFASRGHDQVLTWPEGNGWLAKKLTASVADHVKAGQLVYSVKNQSDHVLVDVYDVEKKTSTRVKAKNVIYAGPRFTAKFSMPKEKIAMPESTFTPWVVGNITVTAKPEGNGTDLAWDNVSYYSPSLGYVVSTHQSLSTGRPSTVLTYYLPLTDEDPKTARQKAFTRDHGYWSEMLVKDLEKMHPGISKTIESVDIWVWGHGMPGPGVGTLWNGNRRELEKSHGRVHFAHSEQSGMSIFEEAQYRGIMAAKKVLASS